MNITVKKNNCRSVNLVYLFDDDDRIEGWILSPLDRMLLKKAPDHQIGESLGHATTSALLGWSPIISMLDGDP